jgi:serine/threonine kinase 32
LEVNPSKRLGYGHSGWVSLVRHPFFRSINWQQLESKSIQPPFQPATENNFDITYDLEEMLLEEPHLTTNNKRIRSKKSLSEPLTKYDRDLQFIEEKFKYFDYTIFEKYEGFKDPVTMTVGDPPDWVKPAFEGAGQGDVLPIKRITTFSSPDASGWSAPEPWRGPNKSASTSNLAAAGGYDTQPSNNSWKRSSLGALRKYQHNNGSGTSMIPDSSTASLSEEYALSLQGIRKKQSTRSFRERRERDRKSIQPTKK